MFSSELIKTHQFNLKALFITQMDLLALHFSLSEIVIKEICNISHNSYSILKMLWNFLQKELFEIKQKNKTKPKLLNFFPKEIQLGIILFKLFANRIATLSFLMSTHQHALPSCQKIPCQIMFLRSHFVDFSLILLLSQNNVHSKSVIVLFCILIFPCFKIA